MNDETHKTLRDEFAMAALTGMICHPELNNHKSHEIADIAYDHADAMMIEREKSNEVEKAKDLGVLTTKQSEILEWIISHYRAIGMAPTNKEVQREFDYKSINSAISAKQALLSKGYLFDNGAGSRNHVPLYDIKKVKLNFV